jgi:acyl-CoA reductase-like NAD-dependent aldehyde dehydrogenase
MTIVAKRFSARCSASAFETEDEVIARANDTPFGLAAG